MGQISTSLNLIHMNTQLLQEWTKEQFKSAEKAIVKYLNSRFWETHHSPDATPFYACKYFHQYAAILGFAYTSSSSFAGYWINNTSLFLDIDHKWRIIGFAMGKGGFVYAICWDAQENEIIFPIN